MLLTRMLGCRSSVLVAAALATLSTACVTPAGRGGAEQPPLTVRVLVYNIHAGKDVAGIDNLTRVAALVDSLDADLALLQEVDRNTQRSTRVDQPATLARLTGYSAAFGKSLDFQGGEYGIAILSRWRIVSDTVFRLPVEPPQERSGGSYEPRSALVATIQTPVGPLVALNTHLDPLADDRWRRQEVKTVLALVDSALGNGARVIAGGDFNSTPESAVQATIRASGLRDSWTVCGRGDGFTYPADSSVKRIDYLFLTGRATCGEATVVRTAASDHRPLLVIVRL